MQSKLHIDLTQGLVEIEGDTELVREIYRDLKDHLLSGTPPQGQRERQETAGGSAAATSSGESTTKSKARRRSTPRKKAENETGSSGINADAPKLDKNLDTSKLGAFYRQFAPKHNYDKILIFLKFLTEEIGIENPNTDQIYTCFKKTGAKIPKAFAQALRDTSNRQGFIDFRSPTDIAITIAGDNHFNHDLPKAAE